MTFGEFWWETHKAKVIDDRIAAEETELMIAAKKDKARAKAMEIVSDQTLQQRMGFRYFLMPWTIAKERNRLTRIAALEHDLEHRFQQEKRGGSEHKSDGC